DFTRFAASKIEMKSQRATIKVPCARLQEKEIVRTMAHCSNKISTSAREKCDRRRSDSGAAWADPGLRASSAIPGGIASFGFGVEAAISECPKAPARGGRAEDERAENWAGLLAMLFS
ncbi:hypothetical protein, partial [uncultured Rikenella sp.]|uniref:hypothetical protein n=1 Tax=uncultured Rikenella sp. TaxID=368003 RepID=UPI002622A972